MAAPRGGHAALPARAAALRGDVPPVVDSERSCPIEWHVSTNISHVVEPSRPPHRHASPRTPMAPRRTLRTAPRRLAWREVALDLEKTARFLEIHRESGGNALAGGKTSWIFRQRPVSRENGLSSPDDGSSSVDPRWIWRRRRGWLDNGLSLWPTAWIWRKWLVVSRQRRVFCRSTVDLEKTRWMAGQRLVSAANALHGEKTGRFL